MDSQEGEIPIGGECPTEELDEGEEVNSRSEPGFIRVAPIKVYQRRSRPAAEEVRRSTRVSKVLDRCEANLLVMASVTEDPVTFEAVRF